jgi:hypothetical protein
MRDQAQGALIRCFWTLALVQVRCLHRCKHQHQQQT